MPVAALRVNHSPQPASSPQSPRATQEWTAASPCPGALSALTPEPQNTHSIFLCSHRANSGRQACTALVQRRLGGNPTSPPN